MNTLLGGRRRLSSYFGFSIASPFASGGSIPVVSPYTDINTLIANTFGGNVNVTSFWDCRGGVTASSGSVTTWADIRTVSPGPSMTYFGSGTNPTWAGSGLPIIVSSLGASLETATSSLYVPSGPGTVIIVGMAAAISSSVILGGINGFAHCDMIIQGTGGSDWATQTGNSNVITSSAVSSAVIIRANFCTVNSTGTTGTAQTGNHALQSSTIVSTTDTGQFIIGADSPSGTLGSAVSVYAAIYTPLVLNSTQVAAVTAWAVANHSAVAAT